MPADLDTADRSEKIVFAVEGQLAQDPTRWDAVGTYRTEAEALGEKSVYLEFAITHKTGWLGFRIVKVTTIHEVVTPNAHT